MSKNYTILLMLLYLGMFTNCRDNQPETPQKLYVWSVKVGDYKLTPDATGTNLETPVNAPISIEFSSSVDVATLTGIQLTHDNTVLNFTTTSKNQNQIIDITPEKTLLTNTAFVLSFSANIKGANGEQMQPVKFYFQTVKGILKIKKVLIDNDSIVNATRLSNVALLPTIKLLFDAPFDPQTVNNESIRLVNDKGQRQNINVSISDNNTTAIIVPQDSLYDISKHSLFAMSDIVGSNKETFETKNFIFYTRVSGKPKFPVITDDELLTLVQQRTFNYFWDGAHASSGMARERDNSADIVTTGGSGFGLMAILVGAERGFVTRQQVVERITKIVDFLTTADRFHGAWSHWINGNTGKVIPFSNNDNGGDLVETSFMAQGLITVRQYLNTNNSSEATLIDKINNLLDTIEWTWYNHDGQNMLSWHWSPTAGWAMGMHVRGYNEGLITYFMAATSKNYRIAPEVYHNGWAGTSYFRNGKQFYGYTLPLGFDYGGPLFFAHYSFLGLNPKGLSDKYADYWTQNTNHTLINRAYCVANPKKYLLYGADCWGLTASDDHTGYGVHEPSRDIGTISPTAALSSMPYTPDESMKVIRFLYYHLGDRVWGQYGFYDAFTINEGWYAKSYLAIDQGPIVVMIENHRTQLLWKLFMSAPEVQSALTHLGFSVTSR